MSNKSLTIRRIVIFSVLAFLPLVIMVLLMNLYYGELIFVSEKATVGIYLSGMLGMMFPAAANILTRLITREGMGNNLLALNFKGHGRWYAASVLAPLGEVAVAAVLLCTIYLNGMSFGEIFPTDGLSDKTAILLFQIEYSMIVFFPAFGEEWGWRGYLMPKLCEVMSKPAAVVVGGVIWGLWHAPLTISGHNFGVDYPGYPFVGILLMCVLCVADNAFLTLLTEKTGSIYPASFFHMLNNNCSMLVFLSIFGSPQAVEAANGIPTVQAFLTIMLPPTVLLGVGSFILLLKKRRTDAC